MRKTTSLQEEFRKLFKQLEDEGLVPTLTPISIQIAHHGTDIDSARNIVKEQKFKPTGINGRLGHGVYFYENGPAPSVEAALDWGKYAPGRPVDWVPGLVAAKLEINHAFDALNPANFNFLNRLMGILKEKMGDFDADISWEQFTAKVVGLFAPESERIEAIRSRFALQRLCHPLSPRLIKDQKGLAIRNEKCILEIRLIE